MKTKLQTAILALATALAAAPSVAQDYPSKPVRIVVTFPPGGSSDVTARALSVPLQKNLGQAVVVDRRQRHGVRIVGLPPLGSAKPLGKKDEWIRQIREVITN